MSNKYENLLDYAKNGHIDSQILLASNLLTKSYDKSRVIEAYKWLFFSSLLGNTQSNDMIFLVRINMPEVQVIEDDKLVAQWCSDKQDEYERDEINDWHQSLLKMWKDPIMKLKFDKRN